ncbi:MAG: ATP-binding protein [Chloroflexota bacterium]
MAAKRLITFRSAILGLGAIAGLYLLLALLFMGRASWYPDASNALLLITNLIATLALAYAALHSRALNHRLAQAWTVLAVGQGLYLLADVIFIVLNQFPGAAHFPSIADIFYLAYYPVFAAGLLLLPASSLSLWERRSTLLDITIVMLSASLLVLNFLIAPLAARAGLDLLEIIVAVAYPAFDLVLFFVLLQMLFRRSRGATPALLCLQISVAFGIVADVIYSLESVAGAYAPGNPVDFLYVLSFALAALAGVIQVEGSFRIKAEPGEAQAGSHVGRIINWVVYTPYLWGLMAFLVLAFRDQVSNLPEAVVSAFVGGIFVLTMLRQVLVLQENTRLYQGELHRLRLAEALAQAAREMASSLDFQRVPGMILDQLAIVVPYERCSIMLEKKNHLFIAAQRGFPENDQRTQEVLIAIREDDPYLKMAETCRPTIIEDVTQEPGWTILPWLPLNRSWMGVPLIVRDELIGMISMTRREAGAFGPEEMEPALAFAGQAAVTLENSRLYGELDQAYRTLEILDRAKSNFIEVVAHELRTPLTVIKGYTQTLASQPNIDALPDNLTLLDGIGRGTDRLVQVVNNMLDMTRLDNQVLEMHKDTFRPSDLIMRVTSHYEASLRQRNLALELRNLEQLPLIHADSNLLGKVFMQLVMNAIKYTPDGGKLTIYGSADHAEKTIEIVIADTGIGIDPAQLELIFEKFYQIGQVALHSSGQTKFKGGGPGLGLPLARGIVTAHGGKIWAESPGHNEQCCPGSQFHVRLPM